MQTRMWKSTSGLALVLFSLTTGGCQLLSSEKASEANASASDAPAPSGVVEAQSIETPTAEKPEAKKSKPKLVAATPLTRPTDPDARVKAIKKGRSNPFAELVPSGSSAPSGPAAVSSPGKTNVSASNARSNSFGTRSALKNSPTQTKPASTPKIAAAPPRNTTNNLPRLSNPVDNSKGSDDIVLPPLPEATLAKQVKVQGVMMIGSQPKAIVKAPNEDVARTVQAGDALSNGQVLVSSIDMSNPQNPKLVLQEAGQTVTVGVGQGAESMTASLPF